MAVSHSGNRLLDSLDSSLETDCSEAPPGRYVVIEFRYRFEMEFSVHPCTGRDCPRFSPLMEGFTVACRKRGLWVAPDEPWARLAIAREGWKINHRATRSYNRWAADPLGYRYDYPLGFHCPNRRRNASRCRYPTGDEVRAQWRSKIVQPSLFEDEY